MQTLETLTLKQGSHVDREKGMCAMEAVAWLANEPHSDAPKCACPVITKFVIRLNDRWSSEERQLLKPYLPRILNTRDGNALKRAEILAMTVCTKITPHAIELCGFPKHAEKMRKATTLKEAELAAKEAKTAAADDAAYAAADAAYAAADAAYAAAAAYAADDAAADAAAAYAADAADDAAADAADAADDAAADAADDAAKRKAAKDTRAKIIGESLSALDAILNVR
jgi:hypothetical protein